MKMRKRATRLITSLGLLLVLLQPLYGQLPEAPSPALTGSRDQYVGDAACRDCHQAESHSYLGSAHHVAYCPPDAASIDGKFTAGCEHFNHIQPIFLLHHERHRGGLLSACGRMLPAFGYDHSQRTDRSLIGSGRKGQTYLYWKGSELFELPVSYWSETGQWMNSPGYPDGLPNFDKPIIPRCLECHATYIESLPPPLNHFEKTSVVLGITCEKCHGAGKMHVEAERSHKVTSPGTAANIVNGKALPGSANRFVRPVPCWAGKSEGACFFLCSRSHPGKVSSHSGPSGGHPSRRARSPGATVGEQPLFPV